MINGRKYTKEQIKEVYKKVIQDYIKSFNLNPEGEETKIPNFWKMDLKQLKFKGKPVNENGDCNSVDTDDYWGSPRLTLRIWQSEEDGILHEQLIAIWYSPSGDIKNRDYNNMKFGGIQTNGPFSLDFALDLKAKIEEELAKI